MHCVKLLGQGLMARDFDRQVAELQVRIALLNRDTALGIPTQDKSVLKRGSPLKPRFVRQSRSCRAVSINKLTLAMANRSRYLGMQ
ncbi:hypothetical protein DSM110093_02924 [Sulfitobacter sp. DSM 110093]|nr:hypothetical protein DSM110093_02924 [Sulfitobacter sp. DSM 110093]